MARKPLTINAGQIEQLPSGEPLDVGGWILPTSGGTENYVLTANVSGNAVWAETNTLDTLDSVADRGATTDQTLTAGGFTTSGTITDGTASLVGGSLTAVKLGTLVANGFVKTSVSDGTLSVDTATYLTAEADTLDSVADRGATTDQTLTAGGFTTSGTITDGTASLVGGSLTAVKLGTLVANGFVKTSGANGTLSVDTNTYLTAEADTLDSVADRGATTDQTLTAGGFTTAGTITDGTASLVGGSLTAVKLGTLITNGFIKTSGSNGTLSVDTATYLTTESDTLDTVSDRGSTTDQTLTAGGFITTGTVTVGAAADMVITVGSITSMSGAISFGNENLTTTGSVGIGTVPSDKLHVVDTRAVHGSAAFWIQQTGASPGTAYGAIIEKTGASQTNVGGSFSATGATNNYGLIVSAGNVGIGTTTPTDKLEVAGNISATTTIVGTNIPSPTIDDQILISTAAGIAGWSTAGVNQVMASDGSGEVAWENKPFGYVIPANSVQYEVYTGTGVGTAAWTKNLGGLTYLQVDSITINNAMIFSSTGAISFSDDNLSTTGTLGCGAATVTSLTDGTASLTGGSLTAVKLGTLVANGFVKTSASDGTLSVDTATYLTAEADTLDTVSDRGATTNQTLTAGGFTTTGTATAGNLQVDNININGAVITSDTGAISFGDENLSTTGSLAIGIATASEMLTVKASASGVAGGISLESTENANEIVQLFQGGVTGNEGYGGLFVNHGATTKVRLNAVGESYFDGGALRVGTLTINGGSITDSTNAISFGDENLSTTGTVVGSNIPSPIIDNQILISTAAGIANWSTAGANQVMASDGSGAVAWINKPFGYLIPANSAVNQIYAGTGAGTAAWTLTLAGLTSVTSGTITDGTASLTGGSLTAVKLGTLVANGFVKTSASDGTLSVDTATYLTAEADTLDTVSDRGATTNQTLTAGGFTTTGTATAGNLQVDNININGAVITSDTGAISFGDENLSTTGSLAIGIATASEMLTVKASASGVAGGISLESTENANEIVQLFQGGVTGNEGYGGLFVNHGATTKVRLNAVGESYFDGGALRVGTLTINGGSITDSTNAISFGDENLSTTGTVVGSNIPSPTASDKALVSTASGVASWYTTCLADVLKIETPSASGAERKFVLTATSGANFEIESAPWPLTLTANETIYVRTTGNDTTGDGSSVFPFLTLERTVGHIGGLYIGDYTVTVDIGEGVFTEAGTITFMHPFGSQVIFQGVSERISSLTTASISGTTSYGFNNLYYRDITMVLPVGKSVSVGDYIGFATASGGTNPNAVIGMHKVSVWVSGTRTATVQVAYRNGSETPSGTITCDVDLVKTVIAFSDRNGIRISGPYYGGAWRGLVIQGDWNGSNSSVYGIWSLNGAVVSVAGADTSGYACGIVGFKNAIYAQNNSLIFADYGYMSKHGQHVCMAQNGGILSLRTARISACNNYGIYAFNGSTVAANACKVVGTGNNSVTSYQGSFIDITSSFVGESNSTTSVYADRWSGIDGTGATVDDAISPSTDGNNDGSYVIGL